GDGATAAAENVWGYAHKMVELDAAGKAAGNQLDEVEAHRVLEVLGNAQTVDQMRDGLREIGIETAKVCRLTNFLIFNYTIDWHRLVKAAQGDNQEEVEQAQRMLADVQRAFEEVSKTAAEAAKREEEARQAEEQSR